MANEKITMTNLRLLLQRLKDGDSTDRIKDALHMSKKTVLKYKNLAIATGKSYEDLLALSESDLTTLLQPASPLPQADKEKYTILSPLLEDYAKRLKNGRYINVLVLWEEYRLYHQTDSCGYYQYTQFKHYVNEYLASKHYSYTNTYIPGKEWQIDYAGDVLYITDMKTGEKTPVVLLVCVMAYSKLTFALAMENARQELFFDGLNKGLEYMGHLPRIARSDNMKQWMKRYDRYEPNYSEENQRWCLHYGITPVSCRPRHPKDKGPAEGAVYEVYRYIYSRIENEVFYSLAELNRRIMELLDELNSKNLKGREVSRWDIFNSEERPQMSELPENMYRFRYSKVVKLGPDYHVIVGAERHKYSVPYQYVNKEVKVLWDLECVEIYSGGIRIATHKRDLTPYKHTTVEAHMPPAHLAYKKSLEMNAAAYIEWAQRRGTETTWAIQYLLNRFQFPEQSYPTCQGVMGAVRKYGEERVERACRLLHQENMTFTLTAMRNILDNNRDKCMDMSTVSFIPANPNVRGSGTFNESLRIVTNNE